MEKSAKNSKGFILYSPIGNHYFFRIYNKGSKTFKDYKINCEEIEIEIISDYLSLYDDDNILDWSSKALGKK